MPASFSGLVWSADGSRLYVGGGFDDVIYAFDHKDGLLSNKVAFALSRGPPRREEDPQRVTGGPGRDSKDGSTLYVANSFGHSLADVRREDGQDDPGERDLDKDTYPYGLCLDEGHNRIYVSLWGAAKVAIVDLNNLAPLGHYETQEHPNEMLTAKKGDFLFVANANRNTVTVIDTAEGQGRRDDQHGHRPQGPDRQHAELAGAVAR